VTKEHSDIGASSAWRWLNCPASVASTADLPDDTSEAAAEGTAAHALAEECLRNGLVASDPYLGMKFPPDAPADKQFEVTREMCKAVDLFINHVWEHAAHKDASFHVEKRFEIAPGMFGRCDAFTYRNGKAYIDDFKYGFDPVEVTGNAFFLDVADKMAALGIRTMDNPQLPYYALGGLTVLDAVESMSVTSVVMTIVQPRAPHRDGPIRSVEIPIAELSAWRDLYLWGAERTRDPAAKFRTGKHCKYCKAVGTPRCTAIEVVAQGAATDAVTRQIADPATFTPDEMGERMRKAEVLKIYLDRLKEQAEKMAKGGKIPTGFKWIAGRGSRAWKCGPKDAAFEILNTVGKSITRLEVLSVAQTEELLTADEFKMVAGLVHKEPGKLKLAPTEDKAPAVDPATHNQKATDIFSHRG